MDEVIENIEFLARSSNRVHILEILATTSRVEKDELQAAIDADRTTLTRNLDRLEEQGWIRVTNPICTITPAGRDIVDEFLDLEETVAVAVRFQEFLRWLSADEFDLDIREFAGAELFTPESGDPYAMVNRHVEKIQAADYQRVLLPVVGLHGYEVGHEQVLNGEIQVELIVAPDVAKTIQTEPQYTQYTDEMAPTDRFEVYVYDGEIPYGLCLLDETVQIFVDKDHEPQAMLETDATPVRDWAEETLATYRAEATQVI